MSDIQIDAGIQGAVAIAPTRPRQTESPATPFREVLANGMGILTSGAEVVTSVIGGPTLAAAVRQGGNAAAAGILPNSGDAAVVPSGSSGGMDMTSMYAMQRESQAFNLQLIHLQDDVQRENQQFTTVSNVLRAKHDTAKAAIGNMRA